MNVVLEQDGDACGFQQLGETNVLSRCCIYSHAQAKYSTTLLFTLRLSYKTQKTPLDYHFKTNPWPAFLKALVKTLFFFFSPFTKLLTWHHLQFGTGRQVLFCFSLFHFTCKFQKINRWNGIKAYLSFNFWFCTS